MAALNDATRGRLLFGGDYNPEQWPAEVWPQDIRLMKEAGVNLATVGVFSWATIEPRPGAREFGWLDTVLDLLHEGGIGVCLATPTASPPPWLGAQHPETLPRDRDGTVIWYGSRNQFCASSPVYREHAARITADLAVRYGSHPALRMWHINNEYGTACWCDTTARHFRTWLRERYGSLAALNTAWGTAFWSQRYDSWDEIVPPRRAQYLNNPAQSLDFSRFTSDALLECFVAERDIVAAHSPDIPVTTNFMPLFVGQDGWRWAAEEDVVSVDIYPDPAASFDDPAGPAHGALVQDLTRSQAGGPWMLMEQAASAVNFRPVNQPKPAGVTRLWSLQAVARGADGVCFFQWRASRQGSEKFHSAMLPHSGEGSPAFARIRDLGAELGRLAPVLGGEVTADIAVLHDWSAWWATQQPGSPSAELDYRAILSAWHHALWQRNLTCDFAHPEADLGGYRMVVIPQLYLLTDAALDNLAAYVAGGGTLVSGFFTGVADEDDRVREGGTDARLREVLGLAAVHEWWPLPAGSAVHLTDGTTGALWSEDLEPAGAETVTAYADGELAGRPAVTRHTYGRGTAWYVSTLPEPPALAELLASAAGAAGVTPVLPGLPPGVEAVRRGELLFLLNHSREQVTVPLPHPHTDLLTGHAHPAGISLDRLGAAVLTPHTQGSRTCADSSSPWPAPRP
ncbi:beta-galactosidase [Streptomyces litchfieldiae]|uniref:Beta-galactosidase n=1 Tax=Streptomyces litchfieldiae TaxID=3075543 RepID=A0ABU2MJH7_9ACTN|nr:beta-galactosidase [Streptomyces sp. DSM 44938]MDT0341093.1 beta-galactosidase [Streptomyces sp. DSM 44938]